MNDQDAIRVLSVDDHPLMQEGLASTIRGGGDMTLVAYADNGWDGIQRFRECMPHVTLMDLRLPDMGGIEAMIAIRQVCPDARVVILTACEGDGEIHRALEAGASSYVLKSTPPREIRETIRKVHAGKRTIPPDIAARLAEHMADERLTARERQVLGQIASGKGNRAIAQKFFISEDTVKVHVKHLLEKLHATDRTHAVAIAARRGLIEL